MSTIFLAALLGLLMTGTATAQERKSETRQENGSRTTLEGNGNMVTRDVAVRSFDALQASGVYELKLSQGDKESVRIEADENLQDLFQVRNEGSRLVIDMKKGEKVNLRTKNKLRVYVTFRNLKQIDLSTVGNVQSDEQLSFAALSLSNRSVGNVDLDLKADRLDMQNSSVGNVKLRGQATDAVVKNSSVGSLEAGAFVVQTLNIDNSGIGSAEVNAAKELKVRDNSMGKVRNRGAAPVRKMNKVAI